MDIAVIKKQEIIEIIDFCDHISEYGHIFHQPIEMLDEPFKKILDGINEVKKLINDSYGA